MKSAYTPHPTPHTLHSRKGFTLIELLVFTAIFTIVVVAFIAILVSFTRVQVRQTSVAEVNQQSQFLLQQIQYYIEGSSLVDLEQDASSSTLKLRMSASSTDPTYIYASGTIAYLKQTDAGAAQPLTSNKVNISSLTFTKRSNAPSHDSVSVSFTVTFNTTGLQQRFTQTLTTAIARVNAATFDSNIIPSSTATYKIGASGQTWTNINDMLYFSGSNVGIGIASPQKKLQVSNGDIYIDTTGNKLILRSPDGVCWWIQPTNAGAYSSTSSTCP
jgi:type II secretory pathway pseudopilin PulG